MTFPTEAIWTPDIHAALKRVGRIGPISRRIAPTYGACHRCQTAWCFVESHGTMYSAVEGCSALCEECWSELKTPEARLPYYRHLWERWNADRLPDDTDAGLAHLWESIETAVRREDD